MKETNFEVALCKEACPLCGKTEDGPILLNQRLTPGEAKKVKALHGQTIGYMDKPCSECQDMMSKGYLLIGVIEEKTDDQKNPYRSGHQWVVKKELAEKIFNCDLGTKGAAFLDIKAAKQIGLPVKDI